MTLLANLSTEQERWEADSKTFRQQLSTVVGDALICAAFIAYTGYFNQQYRQMLVDSWTDKLTQAGVPLRKDVSAATFESCFLVTWLHSLCSCRSSTTCRTRPSGLSGRRTTCRTMTCALRMPSCSSASTATRSSSTHLGRCVLLSLTACLPYRPAASFCSTRRRRTS